MNSGRGPDRRVPCLLRTSYKRIHVNLTCSFGVQTPSCLDPSRLQASFLNQMLWYATRAAPSRTRNQLYTLLSSKITTRRRIRFSVKDIIIFVFNFPADFTPPYPSLRPYNLFSIRTGHFYKNRHFYFQMFIIVYIFQNFQYFLISLLCFEFLFVHVNFFKILRSYVGIS